MILITTLASTTTMTLFSYVVSASFKDLYKEPVLLQYVMDRLSIEPDKKYQAFIGWFLHYFIGLLFVTAYFILAWLDFYKITWLSGIIFGAIGGIIGIIGWAIMFRVSGRIPVIHPSAYFMQLFIAHLIFGLTSIATCYVFGFENVYFLNFFV